MGSGNDGAPCDTDRNGNPNVFNLERNDDGFGLNDNWAKPDNEWNPNNKFVFRLRNCFLSAALEVAVFLFGIIQIFLPAAKHLANFIELQSDIFALLARDELAFPGYGNEKLQCI